MGLVCTPHTWPLWGLLQPRLPSPSYLLWEKEDVSQDLQAQHADLRAGVPEALGQHGQGGLFGEHLQQGRAVAELGGPRGRRVSPGILS